jgi:hypothetical protein
VARRRHRPQHRCRPSRCPPWSWRTRRTAAEAAAPPALAATDGAPPATPRARLQSGDTTRNLFRLQASGQQAGQRLPILGDQATLSYARYLKSFEHEIPDFFETDVARSKDASSSGR